MCACLCVCIQARVCSGLFPRTYVCLCVYVNVEYACLADACVLIINMVAGPNTLQSIECHFWIVIILSHFTFSFTFSCM